MPDHASTNAGAPSKIGAYKIVRLLGKGGMGNVYEAVNEQIQRRAAIKVLHPTSPRIPRLCSASERGASRQHRQTPLPGRRLRVRPARRWRGVHHHGVSMGRRCTSDCGTPAGGCRLSWSFATGDRLRWPLAAAHAKGIIHRDLKPANIMLVEDPETGSKDWIKVLDFGLARVREPGDGEEGRLTQTGMVMGTPSYMSPEQVRSARSVIDKSDVYALGVMFYEMLAGQKPFIANSDAEVMFMHMSATPKPLIELVPGMQAPLYDLVGRMLRKKPEERPTASEVASTLARISGMPSATGLPPAPKLDSQDKQKLEAADTQESAALATGAPRR